MSPPYPLRKGESIERRRNANCGSSCLMSISGDWGAGHKIFARSPTLTLVPLRRRSVFHMSIAGSGQRSDIVAGACE